MKVIAWLCEKVDGLLEGKIGKNSEGLSLSGRAVFGLDRSVRPLAWT
jgi:hypothetical protein